MNLDFLMVFVGGTCGALSRYVLSLIIKRLITWDFPLDTFLINLIGSYMLGVLISNDLEVGKLLFLGVGFMGSFTTFSTFQMENITLFQNRKYKTLALYVAASIVFCVLAAMLGCL